MKAEFRDDVPLGKAFLTEHLDHWLMESEHAADRAAIIRFVNDHPEVVNKHDWNTIRTLALRKL